MLKARLLAVFIGFLMVWFSASISWGAKSPLGSEEEWSLQVEKLAAKHAMDTKHLSLLVRSTSVEQKAVSIEHRADQPMIPASLTKIFTAAAVIDELSPGHRFVTRLMSASKVEGKTLKGDLYLVGGGDPSFVSEKMWFLVNEFVRSGVRQVEGDLVVDDSLFDRDLYPGRSSQRVDRAYDAPVSAMSFNWNSVNVFLRPGLEKKQAVRVMVDPVSEYIRLKVSAITVAGKNSYQVQRLQQADHDLIAVRGKVSKQSEEKVVYKNITRPSLWSGHNLITFLSQRGISLKGQVRRGVVPASATVLAQSKSKSLSQVLADLMKFSNNYVAEMLTKYLSLSNDKVGSHDKGLQSISRYIRSLGVDSEDFRLVNASGLSRENRFTAKQIVLALEDLRRRFDVSSEFMMSLPVAGVDGTLKSRMKGTPAERWARAKTGLLNGVVGLAGYAGRSDGQVLSFAFLYNGPTRKEVAARRLFDEMVVELVK